MGDCVVEGWMSPEQFYRDYWEDGRWAKSLRVLEANKPRPREVTSTAELYDIGCEWLAHDRAKALWYMRVCELVWRKKSWTVTGSPVSSAA